MPNAAERLVLAKAEHDREFAPQSPDENDWEFLWRCLAEHRESHAAWVREYAIRPELIGELSSGNWPEYQQASVDRYDAMIAAFRNISREFAAVQAAASVGDPGTSQSP